MIASSFDSYMKSSLIIDAKVMRNQVLHDCAKASFRASGERCLWQPTLILPSVTPFTHSTVVSGVMIPSERSVSAWAVLKVEPGAWGLAMACRTSLPSGVFVAMQRISPFEGLMATTAPVFPLSSRSPNCWSIGRMVSGPSVGGPCAPAVRPRPMQRDMNSFLFIFIRFS